MVTLALKVFLGIFYSLHGFQNFKICISMYENKIVQKKNSICSLNVFKKCYTHKIKQ